MATFRRRSTSRSSRTSSFRSRLAPAPRRFARGVVSSLLAVPSGGMAALDVIGSAAVMATSAQGLSHVKTFGQLSIFPNTLPVGSTQLVRYGYAMRVDADAVAAQSSADLVTQRDFTATGSSGQDKSWHGRRYEHSLYLTVNENPIWSAGPKQGLSSYYSVSRLGTLDLNEAWYFYFKNNSGIDLDVVLDFETTFLLA